MTWERQIRLVLMDVVLRESLLVDEASVAGAAESHS
jgi:hypothetical protein